MPPRRKRIRSDDSENSTVDSKGPSSGSDIQKPRHQSKKVSLEDYDGDCELEHPGKNRVTKTATRSRVLKQKPTNSLDNDSSSSTPAPVTEGMDVDQDLLGFENLVTPLPLSPIPRHLISTPAGLTPEVTTQTKVKPTITPKPLFETPVEKPGKKFKRKRVAKHRQAQNRTKLVTEDEALMIAHFHTIDDHELVVE